MSKYKLPRGTKDILPKEMMYWHHIEDTSRYIFSLYNYKEIRTPIFEGTPLFTRAIGEDTEIVEKEMYSFQDKKGRDFTLRPEGTAPIARAYLSNNLYNTEPHSKLYYFGPMFRYERPQAGRYRQFHQIGVENIGEKHPYADAEVIAMAYHLFEEMGISNLKVNINSVGCEICRPVIEERIKQFLASNVKFLPEHLQKKFEDNPMRILDSKDERVQPFLSGMPDMREALSQESKDHLNSVLEYLDGMKIPYKVNPTLVRGLEYYTETVFEIISDKLGAQNTICGGGRYNNLIKEIGGPTTPAVGFAFGVERAVMVLQEFSDFIKNDTSLVYLAPLGFPQQTKAFELLHKLRQEGITCEIDYNKSDLKSHFKKANKLNASFVIIYGEEEADKKCVVIKDLKNRSQEEVSLKNVINYFKKDT